MAMHPAQFIKTVGTQLFFPPFRNKALEKHWPWNEIYTEKKSNKAQEQTYSYTGIGPAVATPVFGDTYYADMQELEKTQWVHERYTLGAILPQELIEDSQYIEFTRELGAAIGEGHAYSRDLAAAYPLINAFSTFTVYDGSPLCSAHTLKNGQTLNNALPAASLSYSAVWDAILYFYTSMYTDDGLPMEDEPAYLIYHPVKMPIVELLSRNEYEPTSVGGTLNNRNLNLLPKLRQVPCRFLPQAYWFVAGQGFKEDNIFWRRVDPTVKTSEDFDRWGIKFASRSRFSFGPRDFRRIVGNPGV